MASVPEMLHSQSDSSTGEEMTQSVTECETQIFRWLFLWLVTPKDTLCQAKCFFLPHGNVAAVNDDCPQFLDTRLVCELQVERCLQALKKTLLPCDHHCRGRC